MKHQGRVHHISLDFLSKIFCMEDKRMKECLKLLALSTEVKLMFTSSAVRARSLAKLCETLKIGKNTFYDYKEYEDFKFFFFLRKEKDGTWYLTARNIRFNGKQIMVTDTQSNLEKREGIFIHKKDIKNRTVIRHALEEAYFRKYVLSKNLDGDNRNEGQSPSEDVMRNWTEDDSEPAAGVYQGTSAKRLAQIYSRSKCYVQQLAKRCVEKNMVKSVNRRIFIDKTYDPGAALYPYAYEMGSVFIDSHYNYFVQLPNVYLPGTPDKGYKLEWHNKKGWIPQEEKFLTLAKPSDQTRETPPDIYPDGEEFMIKNIPTRVDSFLDGTANLYKKKREPKGRPLKERLYYKLEKETEKIDGELKENWRYCLEDIYKDATMEIKKTSYFNSAGHKERLADETVKKIEIDFVNKQYPDNPEGDTLHELQKSDEETRAFLRNVKNSLEGKAKRLLKNWEKTTAEKVEKLREEGKFLEAEKLELSIKEKFMSDFIPEALAWKAGQVSKQTGCKYSDLKLWKDIYRLGIFAEIESLEKSPRKKKKAKIATPGRFSRPIKKAS